MAEFWNHWTIIFLLVAGHGFFLASILCLRGRTLPGAGPLALLLWLFSASLLYYVAFWNGITKDLSPFWGLVLTFPTLYGPLMYFYLQQVKADRSSWWHLAPFVVHFVYMTGYYGDEVGIWQSTFLSTPMVWGLTIGQNLMLLIYAIHMLVGSRSVAIQGKPWLGYISWAFLGFAISFMGYYILILTIDFKPIHDYIISIAMSVFMFLVGYICYGSPLQRNGSRRSEYQKSGLSEELARCYRQHLLSLMNHQKPYTNGDLKLADLAGMLDMSVHHLSELINSQFQVNFSEFLNGYRIRDAKDLLSNHRFNHFRVIDIAYKVGFNNKTSFSQTFKKHFEMTPSQYRATCHQNILQDPIS